MGIHSDVYEFAARAGAFEGYVYERPEIDPDSLEKWVDHLIRGYASLPPEVRAGFQPMCNGTIGRAIRSLLRTVGSEHEIIGRLKGLIAGDMPSSPDDFDRSR